MSETMTRMEKRMMLLYFIAQAILFLLIKWAEFTQPYSVTGKVMYSSIVLNTLIMLYFYLHYKGDIRIPLALFMTLIADYFLTLTDTYFEVGVLCFFVVQLIYGWKITYHLANVLLRLVLFLGFSLLMYLLSMPLSFCIVCGCSISALIGNVLTSAYKAKQSGQTLDFMLAMGLILFAGCDLSLGLRMVVYENLGICLAYHVLNFMIWVFYLPSQVILTDTYIMETRKKR